VEEEYQTLSLKDLKDEVVEDTSNIEIAPEETLSLKSLSDNDIIENPKDTLSLQSLQTPGMPIEMSEPNKFVDLDTVFDEYGRKLVKEDFLEDDRLMEVVYQNLEARYQPAGVIGTAYRGVSGLAGGDTGGGALGPRDYRTMDREEAFEIWQNYQRSFTGGQSITTVNEIALGMSADSDVRNKLGAGYLLFDQMDNAFTGEGSWSEMFDATYDYGKAAIYDPTTILSFGLGKIFTFGATKAASTAARLAMIKGFQTYVKNGMSKTAARQAVGKAVAKAAPVVAAEAVINVGVDAAYQMQLIKTDAQEEFSLAQSAMVAAGSILMPAFVFGTTAVVGGVRRSDLLKDTWIGSKELDLEALKMDAATALAESRKRIKGKQLIDAVDENFGKIEGKDADFLSWEDLKAKSKALIKTRKETMTDDETLNAFFKHFWLGSSDGSTKGYYQALKDAGFVVTPAMIKEYGVTGTFAQTIKFLKPAKVKQITKAFEDSTGLKLKITKTPLGLATHFADRTSEAGTTLWLPSQLSRLEKLGKQEAADAIKNMRKGKMPNDPKKLQFALSIYKRLITSHLSTTGANIKGFSQLVTLNTAADFATAGINLVQGVGAKIFKNPEAAEQYFNRSYGSLLGAIRRGASALSPELDYKYAQQILELNPKTAETLFRDVSGDGGVRDSLEHFNLDARGKVDSDGKLINPDAVLDPNSVTYLTAKGMDSVTKGAQTVTLVRMQDEVTKTWAFGTNVNQYIMREYGVSPQKFFDRSDAALEMASDRFQKNVLEKSAFRTMRETASVNWSTLPANNSFRSAARFIENMTNKTPLGFIVPFGSFLNTTIATMGDLSGFNAIRFSLEKMSGKKHDFATQEGAEAYGRMAAGWGAVALGTYAAGGAIDRVKQGLAWNQERNSDGSLEDRTFDWPYSTIRVIEQMIAHATEANPDPSEGLKNFSWEEIPDDLWQELRNQVGGQSVRDLKDFERSLLEYGNNLIEFKESQLVTGEFAGPFLSTVVETLEDFVLPPAGRFLQGASRPFDPINQIWGLVSDKNMTPDLRQGPEKYNQSIKYVNNLFDSLSLPSSTDMPRRAMPTRGTDLKVDPGKQVLGVRGSREPNLVESMLNAAGKSAWRSIKFDGPAEVKNYMDGLVAPYLESSARKLLKKNPKFFEMNQADKEVVINNIITEAKTNVEKTMQSGILPRSLEMVRVLSGKNKDKVTRVMKFLAIEGELEDILKKEDALSTLQKIDMLVKNYDKIFHGDLKLD
tara:strand:+ start:2513 stop:6259 length:3747 start_codon:yes stop_codon:yes gene_type:complete